MGYWDSRGVLTINDPCGRYVGLQSVARSFLTRQNIDISYLGPAESPTAVVVKLTPTRGSKEVAMHMKADYFVNATPELFGVLLSQARSTMGADKLAGRNSTYHIYYNDCMTDNCTEEEFYNGTPDYTYKKRV